LENRSNDQIDAFMNKMYNEFGQPPFNCNGSCMGGPDEQKVFKLFKNLKINFKPASFAKGLHDATYAYFRALNQTAENFGYLTKDMARNGTLIINMSHGEFQGFYFKIN
jgi:hypothetical protein